MRLRHSNLLGSHLDK
uniref:Uncharacterized protein n=1 Tax=Nymphaea colorata TaxID=210225 RepID=A0A5K0V5Y4_9MAGN